ncbi:MAG: hypothetical protein NT034_01835 [Candidatus Magasanikbacteria bacterium]|nr:hypothetical protein [Candidatus Magasanikbacteria bacterium]
MCFSASASFAASAILGVVGVSTIKKAKKNNELLLAAVPFVFAIQQFIEGWLWVSMGKNATVVVILTCLFLFFALFWWPAYIPVVCYFLEKDKGRKNVLLVFSIFGVALGLYLYGNFLWNFSPAILVNKCVFYSNPLSWPLNAVLCSLYAVVTVGALVMSSKKAVNLFGLLAGFLAALCLWVYLKNFVSVWCFFASLVSVVLYLHFKRKKR